MFYYVGYTAWLLPSHSSHDAFIPSPQTVDPDRDRFGPDPGEPSTKSNNFSSPKRGEMIKWIAHKVAMDLLSLFDRNEL